MVPALAWLGGLGLGYVVESYAHEDPQLRLEWVAPTECPSADNVRTTVVRALGMQPPDRMALAAEARIDRVDSGFRLRLVIDDGSGAWERTLESVNCEELSNAGALILVMTVDPRITQLEPVPSTADLAPSVPLASNDVLGEPPVVPPIAAAPTATAVASSKNAPPSVEPTDGVEQAPSTRTPAPPRRRLDLRFLGRAQAGFGFGPLPRIGATIALGLGFGTGSWLVEATGNYWMPVDGDEHAGLHIRAQLWSVGLRGCGQFTWSKLSVPICGGVEAGQIVAEVRGDLQESRTAGDAWAAATAGIGIVGWLGRGFGVCAHGTAQIALRRPGFDTQPSGTLLWRARPAGVQILAGLCVRSR